MEIRREITWEYFGIEFTQVEIPQENNDCFSKLSSTAAALPWA